MAMTDSPGDYLPHRPPFLFLTTIFEAVAGDHARGEWVVEGSEDFFLGHFPSDPVVPGVLITEAMAQIAGVALFCEQRDVKAMVAHIDVRFRQPVRPPASILLSARCERSMGRVHLVEVSAKVESAVVAHGHITLGTGESAQPEDLK